MFMSDTVKMLGAAGFIAMATFGAHSVTAQHEKNVAQPKCEPLEVSVYFQPGGTELNEFATRVLDNVMREMKYCELGRIEVDGFADATGNSNRNLAISKMRAEATLSYLTERGFEANSTKMDAKGDKGAIDANGQPIVMRRKADLRVIPLSDAV